MNRILQHTARLFIKEGLKEINSEESTLLFKKMYSHENLDLPIEEVVDNIPAEKLDWAMQQVQRTIEKLGGEKRGL